MNKRLGVTMIDEDDDGVLIPQDNKRIPINVKISMVDVWWTTELTSDGRTRSFGDLMTIF